MTNTALSVCSDRLTLGPGDAGRIRRWKVSAAKQTLFLDAEILRPATGTIRIPLDVHRYSTPLFVQNSPQPALKRRQLR
jgi:hypothetical protein